MKIKNKISILDLQEKKKTKQPIVMLTAYDYPGAQSVEQAGADIILVGDSLAMTVLGYPDTVSVTMDEMLHHCKAVARGADHCFLIGDMPFLSYQADSVEAIHNAGRFLKEAGMDAVKMEGGGKIVEKIRAVADTGILVVGHLGLTPQTATKLGGYKVQGKTAASAQQLLDDALALEDAGCCMLVLESVPQLVAEHVTLKLSIPTIGIGAGPDCDGQVLVFHDLLGLYQGFTPKFVRQYANLNQSITAALATYCQEVREGSFPTDKHSFTIPDQELQQFLEANP